MTAVLPAIRARPGAARSIASPLTGSRIAAARPNSGTPPFTRPKRQARRLWISLCGRTRSRDCKMYACHESVRAVSSGVHRFHLHTHVHPRTHATTIAVPTAFVTSGPHRFRTHTLPPPQRSLPLLSPPVYTALAHTHPHHHSSFHHLQLNMCVTYTLIF